MKPKNNTKRVLLAVAVFVFLVGILCGVYFTLLHGAVPLSERKALAVYCPKWAANEFIYEGTPTDELSCRVFYLTKNETEKITTDISENDRWHHYCDTNRKVLEIPSGSRTAARLESLAKENCFYAVLDLHSGKYLSEADAQTIPEFSLSWSYLILIFDPQTNSYLYVTSIM